VGRIGIQLTIYNEQLSISVGNKASAKEKGLVHSEVKEYIMKDGDVVLFRLK
jgi:ribosome-binding ATPase YchF (GTP1/OBG family)